MGCWDDFCSWWDDWKCCVFCTAIVIGVIILTVLLAAYGFISHVSIGVEEASVTRFDLVGTSPAMALAYDLSLTLTVHNPNWAMTIKNRKKLDAACSFDGQQFDRLLVAHEGDKLDPRNSTTARHIKCDLDATCPLKLQLALPGTLGVVFPVVKCKLAKPKKYC